MNYVMRWNNYTAREKPFEKDVEFHTYIAKCSKNRVVETLVPIINTAVMTFGNLTHRKLMEETIETHRAVTDAIQKGDSIGARCAMIMHLTYNRQMLMKMMEEREAQETPGDRKIGEAQNTE